MVRPPVPSLASLLLAALVVAGCSGPSRVPADAAAAGGAVDASAAAQAAQPPATETAGVGALEFEWFDATRDRTVPVRLYLPEDGPAGRRPLVVFSHGLGGSRAGYSHLGRHWAAQGFVALHLQHAGSDRALWRSGGGLELLRALQTAASAPSAIARAQDVSFALDRLLADPALAAHVDPERIAIAGHSYGANTALLVAGARFDEPGLPGTLRDPRIRAAVLMSAPPFPATFDTGRVLAGVAIPTLHLTTVDDVIRVPGHWSVAQDRIALYEAMASAPKWLAVFDFGQHNVFTDRGIDPRALGVKQAARELSTAFLQAVLAGRPQALDAAFAAHAPRLAQAGTTASAGALRTVR
jgi:predicted dienelactone hydrolase